MNNIKSFDEYNGYELERVAYDNVLNEKSIMGGGIRGLINRVSSGKVKAQLAEEIELSKSIMEGIQEGLEKLNENFDAIRKDVAEGGDDPKGEKKKTLDEILKIIEDSRKKTWDINELIDEGEIDYAGFTANVGIASAAYFGILFTPFRAAVLMHKGYNYFFGIVKNTIRKALVMLQLNFDQFENLIVAKGFQSADYIEDTKTAVQYDENIKSIEKEIAGEGGLIKNKNLAEIFRKNLEIVRVKMKAEQEKNKSVHQSRDYYNNLNPYDNTYTKSLEALRQYSADDVQKYLDAIKNSMNKLAGQEADLQTFSELILAAAEEHAYKVSSSIYNKFAKMTEVFNLPNQKKLIDLIVAANQEEQERTEAERKAKEKADGLKLEDEKRKAINDSGSEIFKSIDGVKIGEIVDEKYKKDEIEHSELWTSEEYFKLNKDDKEIFSQWLALHPEVLELCDETLKVVISTPISSVSNVEESYIDSLIDYIAPSIEPVKKEAEKSKKEAEKLHDSYILNFDEFIFESKGKGKSKHSKKGKSKPAAVVTLDPDEIKELDAKMEEINDNVEELLKLIYGEEEIEKLSSGGDISELKVTPKAKARLKYVLEKYKEASEEEGAKIVPGVPKKASVALELEKFEKDLESEDTSVKYYLKFNGNIDDKQIDDLKKLYVKDGGKKMKDIAIAGLKAIGEKLLNDKTFIKNSENIVNIVTDAIKNTDGIPISYLTSFLIKDASEKLKKLKSHDYVSGEEEQKKSEK